MHILNLYWTPVWGAVRAEYSHSTEFKGLEHDGRK